MYKQHFKQSKRQVKSKFRIKYKNNCLLAKHVDLSLRLYRIFCWFSIGLILNYRLNYVSISVEYFSIACKVISVMPSQINRRLYLF